MTTIDSRKWIRRTFWFIVLLEIVIVLMDVFLNHYQWVPFRPLRRAINITREDSISNFFSSLQSLLVGVVLLLIYWRVRLAENAEERRWERRGWAVLSMFFVFMAIDDAIKLHERIGSSYRDWLEDTRGSEGILEAFPSKVFTHSDCIKLTGFRYLYEDLLYLVELGIPEKQSKGRTGYYRIREGDQ